MPLPENNILFYWTALWIVIGFVLVLAILFSVWICTKVQPSAEQMPSQTHSTESSTSSTAQETQTTSTSATTQNTTAPEETQPTQPETTTTVPLSEEEQVRQIVQEVVDEIQAMPELDTDLLKIAVATRYMNILCRECELVDSGENWDTAYGFFVEKKWSQTSCIRALGMVLDALGYEWEFVNEDNNQHKWIIVYEVDGQTAFSDPNVVGIVGYGDRYDDDAYYYDWEKGLVFYQ